MIKMIPKIKSVKRFVNFLLIEDANVSQGQLLSKIDWLIFRNFNTKIFVKNLE